MMQIGLCRNCLSFLHFSDVVIHFDMTAGRYRAVYVLKKRVPIDSHLFYKSTIETMYKI